MIQKQDFGQIALAIATDLHNLPRLLPDSYKDKQSIFEAAINSMKQQYFASLHYVIDDKDGSVRVPYYILAPKIYEDLMLKQKEKDEIEARKAALDARKGVIEELYFAH